MRLVFYDSEVPRVLYVVKAKTTLAIPESHVIRAVIP